ncbi:ferrichrome transport ATP-binding protein [Streptococcus pyogenes MGAS9429]|uniref:Ferrichrome transport ATP-binding protein n=1 Tax=Streptococcus pyogenes serotype M12 (strain MGAS9429) TaxID=370551 RepID=Q1JKA6_STRPC|nr:ferrichrome transport ATP-binding protein [Streptococcus pyogenes MGAS9429]
MSKNSSHIQVQNLSFAYEEKLVLDDLTFSIPKGKITTIMGGKWQWQVNLITIINQKPSVKTRAGLA